MTFFGISLFKISSHLALLLQASICTFCCKQLNTMAFFLNLPKFCYRKMTIIDSSTFIRDTEQMKNEIRPLVEQLAYHERVLTRLLKEYKNKESWKHGKAIIAKSDAQFSLVRETYSDLNVIIPKGQYFKYRDLFKISHQKLIGLAAVFLFLKSKNFLDLEMAASIIGVGEMDGVYVDSSSYLIGWFHAAALLVDLAKHSFRRGNYESCLKIVEFVEIFHKEFRSVNFKNLR